MTRRSFRLLAASERSAATLFDISLLASGVSWRLFRLKLRTSRCGMVQVNDAPRAVVPMAESGSAGNDYLPAHNDFQIILHPRGITDKVMRAGDGGKLRRRSLLEIGLAVVVQVCGAAVKITGRGKGNHVWIQAFTKSALIGAVEGFFAAGQLLVQFRQRRFSAPGIGQKMGGMFFEIDGCAEPGQQVHAQYSIDAFAACVSNGREINGGKAQVF